MISDPDGPTNPTPPHVTDPPSDEIDPYFISTICLSVVLGLLIIAVIVYFCCFNNDDDLENGHDKLGKYMHNPKLGTNLSLMKNIL